MWQDSMAHTTLRPCRKRILGLVCLLSLVSARAVLCVCSSPKKCQMARHHDNRWVSFELMNDSTL